MNDVINVTTVDMFDSICNIYGKLLLQIDCCYFLSETGYDEIPPCYSKAGEFAKEKFDFCKKCMLLYCPHGSEIHQHMHDKIKN